MEPTDPMLPLPQEEQQHLLLQAELRRNRRRHAYVVCFGDHQGWYNRANPQWPYWLRVEATLLTYAESKRVLAEVRAAGHRCSHITRVQ